MNKVTIIVLVFCVIAIITTLVILKKKCKNCSGKKISTGTIVDDNGVVEDVTIIQNIKGEEVGISDITGKVVDLGTYVPMVEPGGSTGDYCKNELGEEGQVAFTSGGIKYCNVLKHVTD